MRFDPVEADFDRWSWEQERAEDREIALELAREELARERPDLDDDEVELLALEAVWPRR